MFNMEKQCRNKIIIIIKKKGKIKMEKGGGDKFIKMQPPPSLKFCCKQCMCVCLFSFFFSL